MYVFKERNPPPAGKKINLKDFYYEAAQKDISSISAQKKPEKSVHKSKPKESKIKIPDISEFLRVKDESHEKSKVSPPKSHVDESKLEEPPKKINTISGRKKIEEKIQLEGLSNYFKTNTDEIERETKKNLYAREQKEKKEQE